MLRGKKLTDEERAAVAAAVAKALPDRGKRAYRGNDEPNSIRHERGPYENPTPFHKSNRLRGSVRSH